MLLDHISIKLVCKVWMQKLDYKYATFKCRARFEYGHLASACPNGMRKSLQSLQSFVEKEKDVKLMWW